MPLKDGQLTKRELAFCDVYAGTNDREKAEREAGLAPRSGYAVLSRPEIQREITRRERARMLEGLALVNDWALDTLRDKSKPDTIKRDIAREIWKYTFGTETGQGEHKEPHEMTADELSAELDKLMQARDNLAVNAKDVTPQDIFD